MCRGETSHVCHATLPRRRNVIMTARASGPSEAIEATGGATGGATGVGARTNVGYAFHNIFPLLY